MSEYSHCSICGGSFVGIGNVCPGCEHALSREPLEIRQVERPTRKNSETVRAIISEARGVFDELLKHGYAVVSIDRMADIIDRIISAHKREIADEKRISDAVIQSLRDRKLEKDREVAEKDNEIARLRAALKPVLELEDIYDGHWPFASLAADAVKESQRIYKEVNK